MAIQLQTPKQIVKPTCFDMVHMDNLQINLDQTQYARASITAKLTYYTIDENNQKVFSDESFFINIPDGEQLATQLAMQGDMRGVDALAAIENLISLLIEVGTDVGPVNNIPGLTVEEE